MVAGARTLSGSTPAVPRYDGATRQVTACHCEERSDGTIRIPCGRAKQCANTSGEYGEAADLPWADVVACADTRQVTACHCEERSDVAIRTPCSSTKRNAILWANTESVTDLPEVAQTCQVSLRGNGLPHQCAHWFAMTCKRQRRCCGCKGVFRNDMQKTGRGQRLQGRNMQSKSTNKEEIGYGKRTTAV